MKKLHTTFAAGNCLKMLLADLNTTCHADMNTLFSSFTDIPFKCKFSAGRISVFLKTLLIILILSQQFFCVAQNAIVGPDFSTGWGGGACPTGNGNFTYLGAGAGTSYIVTRTVATTGIKFWRFGVDWGGTTGQYTNTIGSNITVVPSTTYSLNTTCTTNGALTYNANSTYNYVFKTLNAGTNPTGTWVFFEVQGTINTIGAPNQSPLAGSVYPGQNVTVSATMSAVQRTGQNVYLRYSVDNWATSAVVAMGYAGTTVTGIIPGTANTASTLIRYYLFTSGPGNVAADGSNADLYTINLTATNSYTVQSGWVTTAGGGNWSTAGTWVANAIPPTTASLGPVTIAGNVTLDQNAAVSSLTINPAVTLTAAANTLTVAGGTSIINNSGSFNCSGTSVVAFSNAGTISGTQPVFNRLTLNGNITGSVTLGAGGILTGNAVSSISGNTVFSGAATINGTSTITFLNLTVNGAAALTRVPAINGTLQLNSGASLSAAPTYGAAATLLYNAAFTASNNEWPLASGPFNVTLNSSIGAVVLNGAKQINGTLAINAGSELDVSAFNYLLTIGNAGIFTRSGIFTARAGNVIFNGTATISSGTTFNNVTAFATGGATALNIAGCTINGILEMQEGRFISSNTQVFSGSSTIRFNRTTAYVINTGDNTWIAGSGTNVPQNIDITTGGVTIASGAAGLIVKGDFSMSGGAFTLNEDLQVNGNWSRIAGTFTPNARTVTFTGSGKSIAATGGASFYNLTINGTISANSNITITNVLAIGNGNVFSLNGNNASAVTVTAGNTASAINNGLTASTSTFTFNTPAANNTFAGTLTNGAGILNVTKAGTGNLTLNGILNTYTGTTTISAGTLTASAAASLPSNGNISIGNATLALGASFTGSKTLGTLQLTGTTSNLNVAAAGTFDLSFQDSKLLGWTGTFNVLNWTPAASKNIYFLSQGLTNPAQLGVFNFDNYGIGSKFEGATNKVIPNYLYITNGTGGGLFSVSGSWQNLDQPNLNTGVASIYIKSGDILNQDVTYNLLSVNNGGTYNVNGFTINITGAVTPAGFVTNSGIISMTSTSIVNMGAGCTLNNAATINTVAGSVINFNASGGTIASSGTPTYSGLGFYNFNGAGTFSGAAVIPCVSISGAGGVNFGAGPTTISDSLVMRTNASVITNAPKYGISSTLRYYQLGTAGRGTEWIAGTTSAAQQGYPNNVIVGNGMAATNINLNNDAVYQMGGNLFITAGSSLTMNETLIPEDLKVVKNVVIAGTLTLGNIVNGPPQYIGDLFVGGNFTRNAGGTFNPNQRAVFFNGTTDQTVDGSGTPITFAYFVVSNSGTAPTNNVKFINSTDAIIDGGIAGYPLQLLNGNIDLNGRIMSFRTYTYTLLNNVRIDGTAGNLTRQILSTGGTATFNFTNTDALQRVTTVSRNSGLAAVLSFSADVVVNIFAAGAGRSGVDFGAGGITNINGSLQINSNTFVNANPPIYDAASKLIYQTNGLYDRGAEWISNTSGNPGYPGNVIIQGATTLNFLVGTNFNVGCAGSLSIGNPAASGIGNNGVLNLKDYLAAYDLFVKTDVNIGRSTGAAGSLILSDNIGSDIYIGAGWNRYSNGTVNFGAGLGRAVYFNESSNGNITAVNGQNFPFMYLTKSDKNASLTVKDSISVTEEIGFTQGTFALEKDVVILSNNTKTARVGQSSFANTQFNYNGGKFEIQRYLPMQLNADARRWRLLTAPLAVSNAPTINASWQEGQSNTNRLIPINNVPGYGTIITRTTVGANGYDQGSTTNPSIFSYNSAGAKWDALTETNNAAKITNFPGYFIFVRGDRSIVVSGVNVPATPTTLRVKGQINVGDVARPINNFAGYQVLGNPYASAISFNTVDYNGVTPGTAAGLGRAYYLWDPKLGTNVGGWVTFTSLGNGTYTITPAGGSAFTNNGIIESGAAFMIATTVAGGTFTFKESCKAITSSTIGMASRPVATSAFSADKLDFFTANLLISKQNDRRVIDGVLNIGKDKKEKQVDEKDAPKITTFNGGLEKITIIRDGKKISVEFNDRLGSRDTIFYQLSNLKKQDYQLQFTGKGINPKLIAILQDKYTGHSLLMSVTDTTNVPFNVNGDSASFAIDRFRVVFKKSVEYTGVKAITKDADVTIHWDIENELNIACYEIERSDDNGLSFAPAGRTFSRGNSFVTVNYKWLDAAVKPGVYFYRIKSTCKAGDAAYSDKVKVIITKQSAGIYIFPNPATGNSIKLNINKQPTGVYSVRLFSVSGQEIFNKIISYAGGNTVHEINTGTIAKGNYRMQITSTSTKKYDLKLLVQ